MDDRKRPIAVAQYILIFDGNFDYAMKCSCNMLRIRSGQFILDIMELESIDPELSKIIKIKMKEEKSTRSIEDCFEDFDSHFYDRELVCQLLCELAGKKHPNGKEYAAFLAEILNDLKDYSLIHRKIEMMYVLVKMCGYDRKKINELGSKRVSTSVDALLRADFGDIESLEHDDIARTVRAHHLFRELIEYGELDYEQKPFLISNVENLFADLDCCENEYAELLPEAKKVVYYDTREQLEEKIKYNSTVMLRMEIEQVLKEFPQIRTTGEIWGREILLRSLYDKWKVVILSSRCIKLLHWNIRKDNTGNEYHIQNIFTDDKATIQNAIAMISEHDEIINKSFGCYQTEKGKGCK